MSKITITEAGKLYEEFKDKVKVFHETGDRSELNQIMKKIDGLIIGGEIGLVHIGWDQGYTFGVIENGIPDHPDETNCNPPLRFVEIDDKADAEDFGLLIHDPVGNRLLGIPREDILGSDNRVLHRYSLGGKTVEHAIVFSGDSAKLVLRTEYDHVEETAKTISAWVGAEETTII